MKAVSQARHPRGDGVHDLFTLVIQDIAIKGTAAHKVDEVDGDREPCMTKTATKTMRHQVKDCARYLRIQILVRMRTSAKAWGWRGRRHRPPWRELNWPHNECLD